ncbi:MAG: metalloprotease TldD [Legionellales bacterium]|jgi:TldD protein
MNMHLALAEKVLLEQNGLDEKNVITVLHQMLGRHIDMADLYFQAARHESWVLEDSIVKDASFHSDKGVGVRVQSGEKTGFAYSDEIILPALQQAASAARSILTLDTGLPLKAWHKQSLAHNLYPSEDPLNTLTQTQKINLLQQLDQTARSLDHRVTEVVASLSGSYTIVLIVNNTGELIADVRPLVRCSIQVTMQDKKRRERGSSGGGGRADYGFFTPELLSHYAKEAIRQASVNLEAIDAPAGNMPVVLGAGWPGVLLHEAIGHGLEGDFNRKKSSAFHDRIGERVAAPLCTIVDNGAMPGRRGSLNIDDEGTPTQCTTLIENGILKGYMQDKLNAKLMGMPVTGNARRESYAHIPMPRMTNTYMLPGPHDPQEIIKSVKKGIYAVNFAGGQVDITSGKFVFSSSEAYLIEDGKITRPVKGATLIGNGPDVLTKVSMVGNDLQLDSGIGVCGKAGQSVPVGVGQPTLKVDELTVGGTA